MSIPAQTDRGVTNSTEICFLAVQQYQPPVLPGVLGITEATYQTANTAFLHAMFSFTVFLVLEFEKMACPFLYV